MATDWISNRPSAERTIAGVAWFALCLLAACSTSSADSASPSGTFDPGVGSGGTSSGNIGGGTGTSTAGGAALPPEMELDQHVSCTRCDGPGVVEQQPR